MLMVIGDDGAIEGPQKRLRQKMRTWRFKTWHTLILLVLAGSLSSGCAMVLGAAAEESAENYTDKQCAFTNLLNRQAFCLDRPKPPPLQEQYCYKDLGGVTCYAVPSGNNTTASRYVSPYPEVEHTPGQVQDIVIQGNPLDRQVQEAEAGEGPQLLFGPRVQNKSIHTLNPPPQ